MNVHAIVIEQLEIDGTLKTLQFKRQEDMGDLIIAFPDEYDEPHPGPFHFLDEEYEARFEAEMAQGRVRRLGERYFVDSDGRYRFRSSWRGIPTQRSGLTYYALSLPKFAVLTSLQIQDPHSNRQFESSVIRDNRKSRFVIYLECRSSNGLFDFDLNCTFEIDPDGFPSAQYVDEKTDSAEPLYDTWKRMIPPGESVRVQQFLDGDGSPAGREARLLPLADIRDLLRAAFTADDLRRAMLYSENPELVTLADELRPNDGLESMVEKTIDYCRKRGLLAALCREVEKVNPQAYGRWGESRRRTAVSG